nr:hypothetical protein [Tanacetum cinerariifolium]
MKLKATSRTKKMISYSIISYGDETLEEITATVIMMARIQPADDNADSESSYDAKAVSEVNALNKVHEQVNHAKCKTIIHTFDDDQIDSNIIFDDNFLENNGGTSKQDSNVHDEYRNLYVYDPNPNSFNCPPDSYHPPHPTYETYSYDSYGNDSQFGYDCQPQFPIHYESEQGYNENYNSYPYDSSSLAQQYLCWGPHMNYQCQPMNQDSHNSNSLGSDQPQPPQSPVIHQPPRELSIQEMEDLKQQYLDELKRLSNLEYHDEIKIAKLKENFNDQFEDLSESNEEFSSTDDDSFSIDNIDYVEASPPDSELVSSKVMEIVTPEVDAFLAVEDEPTSSQLPKSYLDPEGDVLLLEAFLNDDHSFDFKTKSSSTSLNSLLEETNNFNNSLPEFTTFSKVLFDAEYESDSSDDQSCFDEDILETIVLKPLFEEEIIPMKIDQHPNNAESDLMKSLRTHDSSLPISSKIDSLLDVFAGELTLLKSISPGIDETDCDFEEDIRLIEKLLYDNSSPRPPEEFVSVNSDAKIKSFSPSTILVKDSDSLVEEIDLFCTPDYPMSSGIEDKDCNSERDILIPKDLPSNNSLSFAENESFHFDIPSFSRPPAKPPDGDTRILNIKMMGDISDQKAFMRKLMITLSLHQEKSPDLLSHRGLKAF